MDIDIDEYIPQGTTLIISGGAKGIDSRAEQAADKKKISKLILRPDYEKYGRSAPLHRNRQIVDMCDMLFAFWDGKSRGTRFSVEYANKVGKPVKVITKSDGSS